MFGAAKPHCARLFANRRANCMKVLVHNGVGIRRDSTSIAPRTGFWPGVRHGLELELDTKQFQAQMLGLPWQRVGAGVFLRCFKS